MSSLYLDSIRKKSIHQILCRSFPLAGWSPSSSWREVDSDYVPSPEMSKRRLGAGPAPTSPSAASSHCPAVSICNVDSDRGLDTDSDYVTSAAVVGAAAAASRLVPAMGSYELKRSRETRSSSRGSGQSSGGRQKKQHLKPKQEQQRPRAGPPNQNQASKVQSDVSIRITQPRDAKRVVFRCPQA